MAFLVLWLRFFDLRSDSGAMIFVLAEWTEQFDYSSTAADINHVNAGPFSGIRIPERWSSFCLSPSLFTSLKRSASVGETRARTVKSVPFMPTFGRASGKGGLYFYCLCVNDGRFLALHSGSVRKRSWTREGERMRDERVFCYAMSAVFTFARLADD